MPVNFTVVVGATVVAGDVVMGFAVVAGSAPPGTHSTSPANSQVATVALFAANNADTDTPNFPAIRYQPSPDTTT